MQACSRSRRVVQASPTSLTCAGHLARAMQGAHVAASHVRLPPRPDMPDLAATSLVTAASRSLASPRPTSGDWPRRCTRSPPRASCEPTRPCACTILPELSVHFVDASVRAPSGSRHGMRRAVARGRFDPVPSCPSRSSQRALLVCLSFCSRRWTLALRVHSSKLRSAPSQGLACCPELLSRLSRVQHVVPTYLGRRRIVRDASDAMAS